MKYLLTYFLLFMGAFAYGKSIPVSTARSKPAVLKIDSTQVKLREFNKESLHNYSLDKDFLYDGVSSGHGSWLARFFGYIGELIRRIFGSISIPGTGLNGNFVKYVVAGILIAVVVFVIFKLNGMDLRIFMRRSKVVEVPYHESLENIHEINFEEEIQQAIDHGNYRLAVRLLYLQTLKRLSDLEVIYWKPEKTNEAYLNEIKDLQEKSRFAYLSRQFEYVWYGDFTIDTGHFQKIRESFKQFNSKVS